MIIQYFKLKLKSVTSVLQCMEAFGFIFTPIVLGNFIILQGVPHTLLWYAIVILQGVLIALVFRKPAYLKNIPTNYKLIKVSTLMFRPKKKTKTNANFFFRKPAMTKKIYFQNHQPNYVQQFTLNKIKKTWCQHNNQPTNHLRLAL